MHLRDADLCGVCVYICVQCTFMPTFVACGPSGAIYGLLGVLMMDLLQVTERCTRRCRVPYLNVVCGRIGNMWKGRG